MLCVLDHEIDFDITSPQDMQRYLDAGRAMEAAAAALPDLPSAAQLKSLDGLESYTACVTAPCRMLTDFIDAAFGEGTCNALLGPKTSLDRLLDLVDALRAAIDAQGEQTAKKLTAYQPNRARGGEMK